nr:EOG090X0ATU [Artemia franciscana]
MLFSVPVQPASIDPHQPTFVPQVPQNQSAAYYPTAPSDVASINVPNPLFQPAAASMAMQFGEVIVGQGKQALDREIGRYISTESLKYYFAVDTGYVINKLRILTLPYIHTDWTLKYSTDEPVQPRDDVNAPDLYIPLMAYITFIVLSGIAQGAQNKFTPEALGIEASSKLAWLTVEVLVILLTLYTISMPTSLKTLDIISFCGYKYVGANNRELHDDELCVTFQQIPIIRKGLMLGKKSSLQFSGIIFATALSWTLKRQFCSKSNGFSEIHGKPTKETTYVFIYFCLISTIFNNSITESIKVSGKTVIPTSAGKAPTALYNPYIVTLQINSYYFPLLTIVSSYALFIID